MEEPAMLILYEMLEKKRGREGWSDTISEGGNDGAQLVGQKQNEKAQLTRHGGWKERCE